MKKLFIAISLLLLSALLVFYYHLKDSSSDHPDLDDPVHYHAGFRVYRDGTEVDFTDAKYMNFTPCTDHNLEHTDEELQMEKAHLHEFIGDVVHVHLEGATWRDLFLNIKYDLGSGEIVGYRDNSRVQDILSQPIVPDDSIIIIAGQQPEVLPDNYVTLEHIKEVESMSELCGT